MCGVTITESEIEEGRNVMKCNTRGCETIWVSAAFIFMSLLDVQTCSSFTGNAWTTISSHANGLARAAKQEQHVVAVHRVNIGVT